MPFYDWVQYMPTKWFKPQVGRRARVLAYLICIAEYDPATDISRVRVNSKDHLMGGDWRGDDRFLELCDRLTVISNVIEDLSELSITVGNASILTTLDELEAKARHRAPAHHPALQDMAYAITGDLHEACQAFQNPDLYYPGVDNQEPITDDHVALIIAGAQRELNKELRRGKPAAPLSDLPWRVQRAIAERRRLRYAQWGITPQSWSTGKWSVWEVPEDPEWQPPWGHPWNTGGQRTADPTGMVNGF